MATIGLAGSSSSRRAGTSRIGTSSRAGDARFLEFPGLAHVEQQRLCRGLASASQAASSGGADLLHQLEAEARRLLGVGERRDHGLEEVDGVEARPAPVQLTRRARHHRRLADHGEQAPAGLELLEERARQHRRRAGEHDDVVGRVALPAARGVADLERDVVGAVALEVARGRTRRARA